VNSEGVERKRAAILSAHGVGYSRLMAEAQALALRCGGERRSPGRRRATWRAAALASALLCALSQLALAGSPEPRGGASATQPSVGRWRRHTPPPAGHELSPEQRRMVERLEAIGYASGSAPAPRAKGVTIHDPSRASRGLNFYVSGHAPEARLVDMNGKLLRRWTYAFTDALPDFELPEFHRSDAHWRRAHLFPNGDVLAIYDGFGMIKVDKDSKLLWTYDGRPHHDLDVGRDGRIYVLTRRVVWEPEINPDKPLLEDFITVLSPDGKELRSVSILEAYWSSEFTGALLRMDRSGDLFHTNTIEVLDGSQAAFSPAFRRGNVLISLLQTDSIAVVDLEKKSVVWNLAGGWDKQHQPTFTERSRMLIFDNQRDSSDRSSRVIEFDALTGEVAWEYSGERDGPLRSRSCGSVQRLPNGNTLVTESDNGRAFELTPDKAIVWEYVSPHRAGKDDEYIATLFDLVRLGPEFPTDWLGDAGAPSPP
jgi:hypothetical protein